MGETSDEAREAWQRQSGQGESGNAAGDPTQQAVNQPAQTETAQGGTTGQVAGAPGELADQGGGQGPAAQGTDADNQAGPGPDTSHQAGSGQVAGAASQYAGQSGAQGPGPDSTDAGSEAGPGQDTSHQAGSRQAAGAPSQFGDQSGGQAPDAYGMPPDPGQYPGQHAGGQTFEPGMPPAHVVAPPAPATAAVAGQPLGKKRNPFAVVLLSIITVGIYALYWYGTINAEIRRHDPRIQVSPALAVLAQFVPIVNLVSGYNTAERVKRLEMADGMQSQISPVLSVLFMLFLGILYPIQVQSHLNAQWDHHLMGLGLK